MSRKSHYDLGQEWLHRIETAKRIFKPFWESGDENIQAYLGDYWQQGFVGEVGRRVSVVPRSSEESLSPFGEDLVSINLANNYVRTILPQLVLGNPQVELVPMGPEEAESRNKSTRLLNWQLWQTQWGRELEMATKDALIRKLGVLRIGFDGPLAQQEDVPLEDVMTYVDEMLSAQAEPSTDPDNPIQNPRGDVENTTGWGLLVQHHETSDFLYDPWSRMPVHKHARWIAFRFWRGLDEVKSDTRYNAKARKSLEGQATRRYIDEFLSTQLVSPSGHEAADSLRNQGLRDEDAMVAVWEVHVREYAGMKNQVLVMADGVPQPLWIGPSPYTNLRGFPCTTLSFDNVPSEMFPMGTMDPMMDLNHAANTQLTAIVNSANRVRSTWLARQGILSDDNKERLENNLDGGVVELSYPPEMSLNDVLREQPPPTPPAEANSLLQGLLQLIDRVSGMSEIQRGGAQAHVTATTANLAQANASLLVNALRRKVSDFAEDVASISWNILYQGIRRLTDFDKLVIPSIDSSTTDLDEIVLSELPASYSVRLNVEDMVDRVPEERKRDIFEAANVVAPFLTSGQGVSQKVYNLLQEVLKSARVPNYHSILPDVVDDQNPHEELVKIMAGDFAEVVVLPTDKHDEHMSLHALGLQKYGNRFSDLAKQFMEQHLAEHQMQAQMSLLQGSGSPAGAGATLNAQQTGAVSGQGGGPIPANQTGEGNVMPSPPSASGMQGFGVT